MMFYVDNLIVRLQPSLDTCVARRMGPLNSIKSSCGFDAQIYLLYIILAIRKQSETIEHKFYLFEFYKLACR